MSTATSRTWNALVAAWDVWSRDQKQFRALFDVYHNRPTRARLPAHDRTGTGRRLEVVQQARATCWRRLIADTRAEQRAAYGEPAGSGQSLFRSRLVVTRRRWRSLR
jgi:hypothetical protein